MPQRYLIKSGSSIHPDDLIPEKSTLEVKPIKNDANVLAFVRRENTTLQNDGFIILDRFGSDKGGKLHNSLNESMQINKLRITISKTVQNWIMISEISFE